MFGALLAVLSAISFAFSNVVMRRGVMVSSPSFGLYVTVILGVPLFVIAAAIAGQLTDFSALSGEAVFLLVVAGLIHFLIGRYCNFRAVNAIGVNRTQPIQMTNIFYSIVVAMIVLDERLSLITAAGIVLLIFGPVIGMEGLFKRKRTASPSPADDPVSVVAETAEAPNGDAVASAVAARPFPRYKEGYTFALLSAIAYGSSPIMIRAALDDTGAGILGGLIAYAAAAAVLLVTLALPGKIGELRSVNTAAIPMFLLTTVAIFLAQMFRFAALSVAPVTVIAPLARLGSVFNPILNFIFNRELESFSPRILIAIALSAFGAILMALGIE
jgi:drug/metabolite transporter (DMT)-like permease